MVENKVAKGENVGENNLVDPRWMWLPSYMYVLQKIRLRSTSSADHRFVPTQRYAFPKAFSVPSFVLILIVDMTDLARRKKGSLPFMRSCTT